MRALSLLIVGLVLAGPAAAQEAKKLIVGKWEATFKGTGNTDIKIVAEFMEDGKLTFDIKDIKVNGTYTIKDDNKLETKTTFENQTRELKQEFKVTKDTLELKDKDSGQVFTFKRAK
jgi:uncharacterized protein (TIGR03066 family)